MFIEKKRQSQRGTVRRMGRHGIPIVEKGENLADLFQEIAQECIEPGAPDPGAVRENQAGQDPQAVPRNKHGLPVLDGQGNLKVLLTGPGADDDMAFGDLVDKSLEGKDMDALLREKRERELPGPVPLKKRLRKYPEPEVQLDLHGLNSATARVRADSFVRAAWRNGTFTLRIIVGKGLHSEFGAVLPDVVEDVLADLKRQGIVLWFNWDRKKKSTSGAVIVYLNQFND
ncbi:MAG: Smr/MutS family protein [Pseudomonadota bacterium]